jgi:hypothetical protein
LLIHAALGLVRILGYRVALNRSGLCSLAVSRTADHWVTFAGREAVVDVYGGV